MIEASEAMAICQYSGCRRPIEQVGGRGHRSRLFCSDRCRQRHHREEEERKRWEAMAAIEAESTNRIEALERDLTEANELIEKLTMPKSATPLKKSYQERLTRKGEKLDWPALDIHIKIQPGRKNWRVFMLNESNDQLIRAIIAAERLEEQRQS